MLEWKKELLNLCTWEIGVEKRACQDYYMGIWRGIKNNTSSVTWKVGEGWKLATTMNYGKFVGWKKNRKQLEMGNLEDENQYLLRYMRNSS